MFAEPSGFSEGRSVTRGSALDANPLFQGVTLECKSTPGLVMAFGGQHLLDHEGG